jgi:acyl-CoA thioesterase-2
MRSLAATPFELSAWIDSGSPRDVVSGRVRRPPQPSGPDTRLSLEDVLSAVEDSVRLVDVGDGAGIWQGPNVVLPGYRRLFGGQLLAQAIAAARTPGKVVRSLHLVFLAEGSPAEPVAWSVEDLHDGRTFATRSVVAMQGERLLASGLVSLHDPDTGRLSLDHSIAPPVVPPPSGVPAIGQLGAMAFDTRPVAIGSPGHDVAGTRVTLDGLEIGPPELAVWMRAPRPLRGGGDQVLHQELLAYASDLTMMVAAMRPHAGVGYGSPLVGASAVTSHTISFHRPVAVDDWLLFVQESPAAAGGRAYIRGDWFDESGSVVASCAQEVLIRITSPDR